MYESMFDKDSVNLHVDASNSTELFELVGQDAQDKGFANPGYIAGLERRESKFPTGLIFPDIQLALPHVDPEFVKQPFIYVARTVRPLSWLQMGDSKPMDTDRFMFLGIKEPSKQVGLLSSIIAAFQDENFVTTFKAASSENEMVNLLVKKFTQVPV